MATTSKSIFWAYFWWLFGGFFGAHHLYLRRDVNAFLWWSTLGGYFGLGWLSDLFKIPRYVREVNNDPQYIKELVERMQKNKKPPFSTNRFIGAVTIGYFWGQLVYIAIPEEEFAGIDFRVLHWLVPAAIAFGVWIVGNLGQEQGKIWFTLISSYLAYPVAKAYIFDDTMMLSVTTFVAALVFDGLSKEWRRKPRERKSIWRRTITLSSCAILYLSLWGCYLYFNGKITDSEGNEVPIHEAIHHFATSPWWTDLKQSFWDVYNYAQHNGWYEVWKQIIDLTDPTGEQNAYKVLGLSSSATQAEITATWRKLSREFHPDKVKDPEKQRAAQEKFMEIQQAYEILSNSKTRRQKKNKKSNNDWES